MKPRARLRDDDLGLLLPCVQPYMLELGRRLRDDGHDPCARDTVRTLAEAEANALRGVGIKNSVHPDGAATDWVCQRHWWDCDDYGCDFYVRVGFHADALCLFWGGHWRKPDRPHVQCIPATRLVQGRLRLLRTWEAKDAFVRRYLKPFTRAA